MKRGLMKLLLFTTFLEGWLSLTKKPFSFLINNIILMMYQNLILYLGFNEKQITKLFF